MAIRSQQGDDHIVLIIFEPPEAKHSADLEHFMQLREAWGRSIEDDGVVHLEPEPFPLPIGGDGTRNLARAT